MHWSSSAVEEEAGGSAITACDSASAELSACGPEGRRPELARLHCHLRLELGQRLHRRMKLIDMRLGRMEL